jgi:hypothetical protein
VYPTDTRLLPNHTYLFSPSIKQEKKCLKSCVIFLTGNENLMRARSPIEKDLWDSLALAVLPPRFPQPQKLTESANFATYVFLNLDAVSFSHSAL